MAQLMLYGAGAGAYGSVQAGNSLYDSGRARAGILRTNANTSRAVAQMDAEELQDRKELTVSRARAVAAASGAGVSDNTVTKLISELEAEGNVQALNRLWQGDMAYNDNMYQANIADNEARASKSAGWFGAVTTLMSGVSQYKALT